VIYLNKPSRYPRPLSISPSPQRQQRRSPARSPPDDTIPWILGALGELSATLAAQDIPVTALAGGIYADELFTEARGEATLFLPCAGEIRSAGRVKSVIVPEAELATSVHSGPHTNIDRSYGALATYVAEHALAVPGPIREYYLTNLADTPDRERWRTRIGWPIFQITA
jgi:effector-binding domain-containing protein